MQRIRKFLKETKILDGIIAGIIDEPVPVFIGQEGGLASVSFVDMPRYMVATSEGIKYVPKGLYDFERLSNVVFTETTYLGFIKRQKLERN